jgi:hypothetical protein
VAAGQTDRTDSTLSGRSRLRRPEDEDEILHHPFSNRLVGPRRRMGDPRWRRRPFLLLELSVELVSGQLLAAFDKIRLE